MLYMTDEETAANLRAYVSGGGTLYGTYMMGTVDGNDLCHLGGVPGCGLKEVFGIWAEEIDTLYPVEMRHAVMNGTSHELVDYCETVHLQGAKVLATYADGYYQGLPALTENKFGAGRALYQAARDTGSLKDRIIGRLLQELDIQSPVVCEDALPHGVTAHSRTNGEHTFVFVENYSGTDSVTLKLRDSMENMLTGEKAAECTLKPYSFGIFRSI
jgi:beta-galactosidase